MDQKQVRCQGPAVLSICFCLQVWRQNTLGPARRIGDLDSANLDGGDQMAHDDMPDSTLAHAQHLPHVVEVIFFLARTPGQEPL